MNSRITLVHKNGIVNDYEIDYNCHSGGKHHTQLIWNGDLTFKVIAMNSTGDDSLDNPVITHQIKNFRHIYLNGIHLVKKGRML